MALEKDQIEEEILRLKEEIRELAKRGSRIPDESSIEDIANYIKYLTEERERTNKVLVSLTEKITQLEKKMNETETYEAEQITGSFEPLIEVPFSDVDVKILNFIKASADEMIYADQLKEFMNYKGRNAACARLNALCKIGFLRKYQLGHKVYYKFDAGKATKALIISPPQ